MPDSTEDHLIIVGSGIVGLTQALLLAQDRSLRIAVLDAKPPIAPWSESVYDSRVYALAPGAQQLLERLEVWPQIQAKRLSPYKHMQVWDSCGGELHFNHAALGVPVLGQIVEENLLRSALLARLSQFPSIDLLCPIRLTALREEAHVIELDYEYAGVPTRPSPLRAALLIGADGSQSWVREQAGITQHVQDYQHSALIAHVETEEPHQQTARQVFLSGSAFPCGPLAFLPLSDPHQCSIVWSTAPREAEHLLQLDEGSFQSVLASAFSQRLGKIRSVSKRQIFPLYERHAARYVKNRLALVGDAAHGLHPLAGQGLNLGLADAAMLAEVVHEARKKGRSGASLSTLRRYERARKSTNALMLHAVKLLNSLFASESQSVAALRRQGLLTINQAPWLKRFFARYAMGLEIEHSVGL